MDQFIIINNDVSDLPLVKRFPKLFNSGSKYELSQFKTPGETVTAQGLLPHAFLYALGHSRNIPVNSRPDPAFIRTIAGFLRHAQTTAQNIQLFVPIDSTNSLLGASTLESYLRIFAASSIPVITHLVIWIATPSQIGHMERVIDSLGLQLGSKVGVTSLYNRLSTQSYLRQNFDHTCQGSASFILVRDLASLGLLSDEMCHLTGTSPGSFKSVIESPAEMVEAHMAGHTAWFTNHPSLARYYWGDDISEYVGLLDHRALQELHDEMAPYRVLVLDQRMSPWDNHLTRMAKDRPTVVYWIDPFRLDSHIVSHPI